MSNREWDRKSYAETENLIVRPKTETDKLKDDIEYLKNDVAFWKGSYKICNVYTTAIEARLEIAKCAAEFATSELKTANKRIAELEAQNRNLLEEVVDALQDVVFYVPRPTTTSAHADKVLPKYEQQLKQLRGEG